MCKYLWQRPSPWSDTGCIAKQHFFEFALVLSFCSLSEFFLSFVFLPYERRRKFRKGLFLQIIYTQLCKDFRFQVARAEDHDIYQLTLNVMFRSRIPPECGNTNPEYFHSRWPLLSGWMGLLQAQFYSRKLWTFPLFFLPLYFAFFVKAIWAHRLDGSHWALQQGPLTKWSVVRTWRHAEVCSLWPTVHTASACLSLT